MIPEFGITLGAILGLASFCISNEVIKQKEEERLAKERAEQERQKIAYRKALEACREFEEFKISDEALQKL